MSKIGNSASNSTPALRNDTNNEAKILTDRKAEAFLEIKNKADSYSPEQLSRLKNFIPTLQDSSCRGKCEPILRDFEDIEAALRLVVAHRTVYFGDKNTKTQWFGITYTRTSRKLIQYIDQKLEQHKQSGSAGLLKHATASRNDTTETAAAAYVVDSSRAAKPNTVGNTADIKLDGALNKSGISKELIDSLSTQQDKENLLYVALSLPETFGKYKPKTLDTPIDHNDLFDESTQFWTKYPLLGKKNFSQQNPLTYRVLLEVMDASRAHVAAAS